MKVLVYGALGRMGQTLIELLKETSHDIIGVDVKSSVDTVYRSIEEAPSADVVIDFSHHSLLNTVLAATKITKTPLVIATTGHQKGQIEALEEASQGQAIFKSANLSVAIYLLQDLLRTYTSLLEEAYDIEITETHHKHKLDAPSGTAWMLAEAIQDGSHHPKTPVLERHQRATPRQPHEIGITAVRGGSVVGEHTVHFYGELDSLHFTHKAYTKSMFAQGALLAAQFIVNQTPGLYSMADLVKERRNQS